MKSTLFGILILTIAANSNFAFAEEVCGGGLANLGSIPPGTHTLSVFDLTADDGNDWEIRPPTKTLSLRFVVE